ncbi:ribosome biogenesis GTP-binding protein YihA/YsxC [soil metagenome]
MKQVKINEATFIGSYPKVDICPKPVLPEYAFIGRSNVGKSSLINMLAGRKSLAKISSTPGKTQLINFFLINTKWHLVDLPGYGFAKVSKDKRQEFEKMIRGYLTGRPCLMTVFILVDARIPPQKLDIDFINKTGASNIPLVLIFTKTDKLSERQIGLSTKAVMEELAKTWEEMPKYFITSSVTKTGKDDVLKYIEETNKVF